MHDEAEDEVAVSATDDHTADGARALRHIRTLLTIALLGVISWLLGPVLLLLFAGVLLGVFLRSLAAWLAPWTGNRTGVALAIVVVTLFVLAVGTSWFLAPQVAVQIDEMRREIPRALDGLRNTLERFEWGRELLSEQPAAADVASSPGVWRGIAGAFSTTVTATANLVIVFFVGLYLAVQPGVYRDGLVSLFPVAQRSRVAASLDDAAEALRGWLFGQVLAMFVVGVATLLGLWALGIPLALTLALIAAALTFIPNVGPVIAAVPAVLLGLLEGPRTALLVLGLYVAVQTVESYLVTPLIQRQTVSLPPALTIASQVVLGVTAGAVGLLVATPMAAAGLVLVQKLYVEDALESDPGG
jgi:predicted PurR-regulated permease PerM